MNCCDLKMYASLKALAKSNKNKILNKQAVEIKHYLQLQHPSPPKLEETLKNQCIGKLCNVKTEHTSKTVKSAKSIIDVKNNTAS